MTIVAIHQPQYWPWLGLLDKIVQCDVFLVLDDVQFHQRGFQHRTLYRIYNEKKAKYLTIPYEKKTKRNKICNVLIDNNLPWKEKHLSTIEKHYAKAPYYSEYIDSIVNLYKNDFQTLAELNICILRFLCKILEIGAEIKIGSNIGSDKHKDDLMLEYTQSVGGKVYLSGVGAKNYTREEIFSQASIELRYQKFTHPVYPQYCGGFVDGLFVLDLLFNCGIAKAQNIIHRNSISN